MSTWPVTRGARAHFLVVVGALSAFGPMSLDLYLPAFPQIASTMGVDTGSVQLTFSAALLGLSLGQLNYGPLADRYGRKRPLLAGLILFVLASIACAFAPSLPVLVALRFLQAIGGCSGIVIARAIIRDCYNGADLARALSAVATVSILAPILAPSLGAFVLSVGSWPWVFVVLAAFGAACFVGVLTIPETLKDEHRTNHGFVDAMRAYAAILRNPLFLAAVLVSGSGSMMLFSYISSSPAVFIGVYGLSETQFALLFGANSVFLAIGAQVNMRLVKRVPIPTLLPRTMILQLVGAVGVLIATVLELPLGFVWAPLAIAMLAQSSTMSNGIAEALKPFPRNAGSAAALAGVIGMGMASLMTTVLSLVELNARVEMGLGMTLAVSLGLTMAFRLRRLDRISEIQPVA